MRRIAVLGAGIAGLAGALRLRELATERGLDLEITVYEARDRAGGCIETVRENGFVLETGPDSLLIDKPWGADLLRRLHLDNELVPMLEQFKGSRIVRAGRLRPIPPDFRLFAPTSIPALLGSGIFSINGMARAAIEPFVPARKETSDESLASFVTRRFGREVLDRLAQPLIGGIYSGDPERLGMQATLPQFQELERKFGSILRAMQSASANAARKAPRLMSLRGGLGEIVAALAAALTGSIRLNAQAVRLEREQTGWAIGFADENVAHADAVLCALPAPSAASVLANVDAELAQLLAGIRHNSIATVNLAYDAREMPAMPRTPGFVVPYVEGRRITAATISTQKYPGRAPVDSVLLRAFIGGALQPELLEASDQELAKFARTDLRDLLGVRSEPHLTLVRRWNQALPEYGVGHGELTHSIEQRLPALGGLSLAGAAYHGVGIPDCIHSGEEAAVRLLGMM